MDEWPAWRRWSALALAWAIYVGAFGAAILLHSVVLRVAAICALLVALVVVNRASLAVLHERVRAHDRWKERVMLPTFAVYILYMLYVWPRVPQVASHGLKLLLALLPVVPLLIVVWAALRHLARCDELERRQHVEAAAWAAVVVGVATLALGFVAASGLLKLDAALVLLLVFPALCLVYGTACGWSRWRNRAR